MQRTLLVIALLAGGATLLAAADAPRTNPLLSESPLPLHYPQFDRITVDDFSPAAEQGMTDELTEVAAIAGDPAPATFDNTVVALERSGRLLDRVTTIFSNLNGANTNPAMQKLETELAPKLAAHTDAIRLNPALFARIRSLYERRASLGLDPESAHLLERYYKDFVRSGAKLSDTDKAKLRAINTELAQLSTEFSQKVLKEVNAALIVVDDRAELAGLSDAEIAAAAERANSAGQPGKFAIRLLNTTGQPDLASLQNRALRQRIM